jgi:hypothetical protein
MNAGIFSSDQNDKDLKSISSACENQYNATADVSSALDKDAEKNFLKDDIAILIPLRNLTKDMSEYFQFLYLAIKMLRSKLSDLKDAKKSREKASEKSIEKADAKIETLRKEIEKLYKFFTGNGLFSLAAIIKADTSICLQVIKHTGSLQINSDSVKKKFSSVKSKGETLSSAIKLFPSTFNDIETISELSINKSLVEELEENVELFIEILREMNNYCTSQKLSDSVMNKLLEKCSLASGSSSRSNQNDRSGSYGSNGSSGSNGGYGSYNKDYNSRNNSYDNRGNNNYDNRNSSSRRGGNY